MNLIKTPRIDWIGKRWACFAFSGALLAGSLGSLALRGFNYAIDFTGGTAVQVTFTGAAKDLAALRRDLETAGFPEAQPQSLSSESGSSFYIRLKGEKALDQATLEEFLSRLQAADPGNTLRLDRKEYVGPAVGRDLYRKALIAVVLALVSIVVYVGFRFDNVVWGICGLAALLHDVVATAGLFSITQKEVDLVIVAAIMTIAGYSINDTIVIFDRMRERLRLFRHEELGATINAAVNETLSRTLITNGCVVAVVACLFVLGGSTIHDFAAAMLFGGLVGTYSTIGIATPLVYEWHQRARAAGAPRPPAAPKGPGPQSSGENPGGSQTSPQPPRGGKRRR